MEHSIATVTKKEAISALVQTSVEAYAAGFKKRHIEEYDDPLGTINMKINNIFIVALGPEIQFYTSLVRSLDSSLGNMLEKLAINIAKFSYEVSNSVEGPLSNYQTNGIASLLEKYKRYELRPPSIEDYQFLRKKPIDKTLKNKQHISDYCLVDKETGNYSLIELKIGGDLDNKKARSEKEAILEQFAILSNSLPEDKIINIFFATAYNKDGEGNTWKQERVKQFFAEEELLIGKDFWNFVCKMDDGYETVINAYKEKADLIKTAVFSIKDIYLNK